jgi:hypothetical protein
VEIELEHKIGAVCLRSSYTDTRKFRDCLDALSFVQKLHNYTLAGRQSAPQWRCIAPLNTNPFMGLF